MNVCATERDGAVLTVTLNRPEKLNALDRQMHFALDSIWNDFFDDPHLRVAILTGAGDRAFCAGSDLSVGLSAYSGTDKPYPIEHGYGGLTHRLNTTKPIIAAVNGLALGGGFEVMLCCDLAVASENAEFGLPEPLVGAAAMAGGIPRLCRKIPFTQAMTLMMTGERISARRALQYGLVSEVTSPGGALVAAKALAARVIRCAPLAIRSTKAIADATLRGDDMASILAFEDGVPTTSILSSEDAKEGIAAFLAKRPPVWSGR